MKALLTELHELRRKPDGTAYDPDIKAVARRVGIDHGLAQRLWDSGDHAARSLAIYLVDLERVDERLAERWVKDLDEWGLCDGFVGRVVRYRPFAFDKGFEWAERPPEFEKRAGFALVAQLAWKKNDHPDALFLKFLPVIGRHATDERYYVKKAVNWALRDIGKRNPNLRKDALVLAATLSAHSDRTSRWVGTHRMSEL